MRFQKDDIVIFADDLTGALDAAVQFSKQNIPTIAFPTAEAFLENGDWSYCVYVVNTTTRHVARQEAYETVRALAAAVRQAGCQWVIKKTDSALRGNVGVELEALLDGTAFMEYEYLTDSERLNLEENCNFLKSIAAELRDEKVKFPLRRFNCWLDSQKNPRNRTQEFRKTLAKKKMDIGEIIDILEENKDMLIEKVRGFGTISYERLLNKLKEKANSD